METRGMQSLDILEEYATTKQVKELLYHHNNNELRRVQMNGRLIDIVYSSVSLSSSRLSLLMKYAGDVTTRGTVDQPVTVVMTTNNIILVGKQSHTERYSPLFPSSFSPLPLPLPCLSLLPLSLSPPHYSSSITHDNIVGPERHEVTLQSDRYYL